MKHTIVSVGLLGIGAGLLQAPTWAADQALIDRGEYLARAGDCIACHTAPDGEPYAGGLSLLSPFGNIYSTNITPDKQAGIGDYSREDFAKALRQGKRKDGANLYPAMPYPSYAKLSDEDVDALYAYFMEGVEPVSEQPPQTDLSWPFSMRWGLSLWNWAFAPDAEPFTPREDWDEELNRGAYLVQGLGHCGSCHTPRGILYQLKGFNGTDEDYLRGAELEGWLAPSLRGGVSDTEGREKIHGVEDWSVTELVDYLGTGRNAYSAATGEMAPVIEHSLAYLSDDDLNAMARYLKSLAADSVQPVTASNAPDDSTQPPPMTAAVDDAPRTSTERTLETAKVAVDSGERLYLDNCNACHFTDGRGASRVFPQLNGNPMLNADNPTALIHVILAGAKMPSTQRAPMTIPMPGFAWRLDDDEVARLATFLRSAWDNDADEVSADQVAEVRSELEGPVIGEPNW
ncbi:cytochrome c [Halomonas sp. WWR20]